MNMCYRFGRPPRWFWVVLSLLALLYLLCGCKQIEYVPKVETKIEYRDRVERDTAFVRDSIFIHTKGDTVYSEKFKYIYKEHVKIDTAYIYKCDTITKVRTVEKQLSKWQSLKLRIGGFCMTALIVLILGLIVYVCYKIWKR